MKPFMYPHGICRRAPQGARMEPSVICSDDTTMVSAAAHIQAPPHGIGAARSRRRAVTRWKWSGCCRGIRASADP